MRLIDLIWPLGRYLPVLMLLLALSLGSCAAKRAQQEHKVESYLRTEVDCRLDTLQAIRGLSLHIKERITHLELDSSGTLQPIAAMDREVEVQLRDSLQGSSSSEEARSEVGSAKIEAHRKYEYKTAPSPTNMYLIVALGISALFVGGLIKRKVFNN